MQYGNTMKEKTRKQWFVLQHVQVKCLGNAILALGFSSTFPSKHSNMLLNLKLGNRFSEAIFSIVICIKKKKFLSVVILLDFHLIIYRSWTANLVRGKCPVKTNVKNKYQQKKRESTAMQKMWTAKKRTHMHCFTKWLNATEVTKKNLIIIYFWLPVHCTVLR